MDLHNKAMLVDISISQWSMRKHDRKVTKEIEEKYGAHDAGRYNKLLIAEEQAKIITKVSGEARTFHYENTLPWTDEGRRILPSANYFEYVKELNIKKHRFWRTVETFWNSYEGLKEDARLRLMDMFKESDYPSLETLRGKYRFEISFLPIPDTKDFRINLRETEMNRIKLDLEQTLKKAEAEAVKDLYNRLYKAINHIITRLSETNPKFRHSLIGNVIELSELMPRLNFTNDPHLEELRKEVTQSICTISPDNLRNDAKLRDATAEKAKDIAKKMEGYMGGVA